VRFQVNVQSELQMVTSPSSHSYQGMLTVDLAMEPKCLHLVAKWIAR